MSYRIEYDGAVGKYEVRPERRPSALMMLTLAFVLLLGTCLIRPGARKEIREFLIPGDSDVTVQAFHAMTNDLRSGATLKDAIYDFCALVIQGG